MKNYFKYAVGLAAVAVAGILMFSSVPQKAKAQAVVGYYGPQKVVDSTVGTTNNVVTNFNYPPSITGANGVQVPLTNVILLPFPSAKDIAFQFTGTSDSASTVTNVTIQFARNIQGGTTTGTGAGTYLGTNLNLELLPAWTITLAGVTTAQTFCTNFSTGSAANAVKGAIPNFYIYSINFGAANTVHLTNYSIWCSAL